VYADLHTHLMPGVDDGSPDLPTSVQWIRTMAENGISQIAVTPHINRFFDLAHADDEARLRMIERGWGAGGSDPSTFVASGFAQLDVAVRAADIPVVLHQGGELHPEAAERQDAERLASIALGPQGKRWILLEIDLFSDFGPAWSDAADHVRSFGYDVVIAHPERAPNMDSAAAQDRLRGEIANGVRAQVNVSSLLYAGSTHQRLGLSFISEGLISLVASDVHPPSRPAHIYDLLSAGLLADDDVTALIGSGPLALLRDGC
jgi:protein-tyrosine phosphatase